MKKKKMSYDKLSMKIKQENYIFANISLANCPDDWTHGAFILSAYDKEDGKQKFIRFILTTQDMIKIRDAFTNTIKDA